MKKALFLIVILAIITVLFVSCGKSDDPYGGAEVVYIDRVENPGDYVFVDMQKSTATADMVKDLKDYMSDAMGIAFKSVAAYKKSEYEILVGYTNRQESTDAAKDLKYFDYTIKRINNKIVISAGSDESLREAISLFKSEFIDAEAKALYLPENYTYIHEYLGNGLTVDGVDIKEFKVLNKTCLDEDTIRSELRETFDFELEIAGEEAEGEHYIILDASSYIYEDYSITIENGNIRLYGSGRSIYGALDAFSGEFLSGLGEDKSLTSVDKLEGKIEKPELYTKDQLMSVLTQVYDDKEHIIIGEQSRGNSVDGITKAINTFESATGEKPGIIGVDLQVFGMGIFSHTEPYEISHIICDIIDYVGDGGIVTFSAHWGNPSGNYPDEDNLYRGVLGYDYTMAGYEKAFTDLLTPGTEYNTKWMEEIDREVEFFLTLQENGVPAIWRPLHESNGNWFWFCTTQTGNTLDASYIKNIWYFIFYYFKEKGIENLLWCFAPNYSPNYDDVPGQGKMSTTYLYPGDEYCDIVGVDWYTQGNLEIEDGGYLELLDAAKKPGAITEFGSTGEAVNENGKADPALYSAMNACRDLKTLISDGYSFTYLMTWGGSWGFSFMGEGKPFMAEEMTLGQSEVKAIFDALK